jgi:hypothetical protein
MFRGKRPRALLSHHEGHGVASLRAIAHKHYPFSSRCLRTDRAGKRSCIHKRGGLIRSVKHDAPKMAPYRVTMLGDLDIRAPGLTAIFGRAHAQKWREGLESASTSKSPTEIFRRVQETDLHFFLGTTLLYPRWAANPWLIIGVFPAPVLPSVVQQSLF